MKQMQIEPFVRQIVVPRQGSSKGDNGRVLVIGGSKLFHAASFWAAAAAAKIVDMVHFTSPTFENNELMRVRAKAKFWDGIVVPYEEVLHYIEEDDVILIGPGMERGEETREIVDRLLASYPNKRWVVDGGALQMVDPRLLTKSMIVTPNRREMGMLLNQLTIEQLYQSRVTVLAKGRVDVVTQWSMANDQWTRERIEIDGGDAGMTKGGTGDVLSGIVAGLYAKSPALSAAVIASYVNKRAGEQVAKKYGIYYSAIDLLPEVQRVLASVKMGG